MTDVMSKMRIGDE